MTPRSSRIAHRSRAARTAGLVILAALVAAPAVAHDPAPDTALLGPFDDVPTYRVDDYRRHVQPGAATRTTPGLVWSEKVGDEIHFNPILLDGTLFIGDYEGRLHALDPMSGASQWTYQADGPIDGASAQDGTVVFSDGSGRLHAVDAASGEARWVAEGGYVTSLGPSIADGVVYWGTEDAVIHGIELESGEEVWSHALPAAASSITIADGVAFVGTADGMVHAISIADGGEVWRPIHLLSDRPSSMPVDEGTVYVASNQPPGEPAGELLAVDAESGEVKWRFRSPSGRQVTPGAVRDGVLYVASEASGLYALDAMTGATVWRSEVPLPGSTPVTLAGDVLITPADFELVGFDAADGAELWRVPLAGSANTGPIVSGGLIFQADDRGNVWAYGDPRLAATPASAPPPASATEGASFRLVDMWDAKTIEDLDHPSGSDVGPDGLYYVLNAGTSEVLVIDADGAVIRRWGRAGTGEGEFDFLRDPSDPFSAIGGVAVAPGGSVYVADTVNRRVQQFTQEGDFVRQFGSYGTADGQFLEPIDLDVGPDGSVYVVDDVRDDIQRFSADGTYLQTIGRQGSGEGELQYTASIVVADDGTLLNADWDNDRVQAWDADGEFLWSIGSRGSGAGEFRNPGDVAVDSSGRWFVTDFENGRVQAFGADHEVLGEWVVPAIEATGPGYAITAADDGRLYLNMPFGDTIAVLEYVGS